MLLNVHTIHINPVDLVQKVEYTKAGRQYNDIDSYILQEDIPCVKSKR